MAVWRVNEIRVNEIIVRGLMFAFLSSILSTGHGDSPSAPSEAYQAALARAVRGSAESVLGSVVTVEVVGAGDASVGEVRVDAPTCGVVVDAAGYILASSMVEKGASASRLVLLPDGTRHAASVVARDERRDLTLLKIDPPEPLEAIGLPEELDVRIGQTVVAVGRYGSDSSPMVSTGVLSGVGRLDGIALQTDARVSPSFYGGPLVDLRGNVIGILVPAVAEGGAADATSWYDSGIAFAIPADVVAKKLDRLKRGEEIRRGLIGIVARSNDPYEDDTTIAAVRVRSPAGESGLEPGDRVTEVAGIAVRRHQEIKQVLGPYDAGETIEISYERDGEVRTASVTLADTIPPLEPQRIGVVVADVARGEATRDGAAESDGAEQDGAGGGGAGERGSAVVVRGVLPGSPADGRLLPGDVITGVGDSKVAETRSLRRLMVTAEPGEPLEFRVLRGESAETGSIDATVSIDETVSIEPADVGSSARTDYPERWDEGDAGNWSIEKLTLPDAANEAAVLRPTAGWLEGQRDLEPGSRLGLLVLLQNPGESAPRETLEKWLETAAAAGVVVCAVAPEDNARWQAKEIEVVSRMTSLLIKQMPIESSAVALASGGAIASQAAEAADSMAVAVGIRESRTFAGVAVSDKTQPPPIRIRENEPSAALQIMLPIGTGDELPGWGRALEQRGYPIVRGGGVTRDVLARWTRLLQAI